MAAFERVEHILFTKVKIKDKDNAVQPVSTFETSIEYRDVGFSYDTEPVLKNIDLTIEKGKTIAIVGKSGSGKSTLVDLLPRFIDPDQRKYPDRRESHTGIYKIADLTQPDGDCKPAIHTF